MPRDCVALQQEQDAAEADEDSGAPPARVLRIDRMAQHTVRQVTATEAPAAERPVIDSLLQLYLHDFSEHAALGSPYGEVDEDGFVRGIGSYWQGPDHVPLLIWADGRTAGSRC
jgi:hypothetical protein